MVGKDSAGHLGCDNAVSILHRFAQIDVLDRELVSVHFQIAAGGWDIACQPARPAFWRCPCCQT